MLLWQRRNKLHHKNWKVELTAGGQTHAKIKIERDIIQDNSLTDFYSNYVNYIQTKCRGGYKFTKSQDVVKNK